MNFNLLAEGLDGSLAEIVAKLQSLIDSFWIYIVIALAAVVVIWGAYIGIKIAIAHRNEEKINARDMIKNLVIGIVIIFVVAMGAPLLLGSARKSDIFWADTLSGLRDRSVTYVFVCALAVSAPSSSELKILSDFS